MAVKPLLSVSGLTKRYPGVTALDDVGLEVAAGEVHVLVGENGAGKSTFVKCLAGIEHPDSGSMTLGDAPHRPAGAAEALASGVRVVHQELAPLPGLSVAENLYLQRLPSRYGVVNRRQLDRNARDLLERVGLDVSPRTPMEQLGIAQMQLVEIAKALSADCRLLIMDEPTATLTPPEVARLFTILRQLTADGVAIIYISHHLEEIFEIGDRVSVLRNGRHVATHPTKGISIPELVKLMVGRDMAHEYPPVTTRPVQAEVLKVTDLRLTDSAAPISLSVRAGEIVGMAGLVGSGRTETIRAIFGADRAASGTVSVRGRAVRITHPVDAVRNGISLLTEDRKSQGLLLDLPIASNISLASLGKVSRAGLLRHRTETDTATALAERLQLRSRGIKQHPRALSGGNQQKVVLAKWLAADADLLIVDEPTRGIDVGARYEIHQLMIELAEAGKGLLIVSSDLPELLGICDRLLVFSRGAVAGELNRSEFDAERILNLAYSGYRSSAAPSSTNGKP